MYMEVLAVLLRSMMIALMMGTNSRIHTLGTVLYK